MSPPLTHEEIDTMWAKFDDSFPNHPKVVAAGPLAALIQVRAICYSARFLTDGFIPTAVVPELVTALEPIDWPSILLKHRLWDLCDGRCKKKHRPCEGHGGYFVHDFLAYNLRKKDVEKAREDKRLAGEKGAKSRWNKPNAPIAAAIAPATASAIPDSMPPSLSLKTKDKSSTAFDLKGGRSHSQPVRLGSVTLRIGTHRPTLEQDLAEIEAARQAKP